MGKVKNTEIESTHLGKLSWFTAWPTDFSETIHSLVHRDSVRDYLEIGGTTHRALSDDVLLRCLDTVTVLDIDKQELLNVSEESFLTIHRDVCGDVSDYANRFDIIVSKFCAEHVKDGSIFHRNISTLLRENGKAVHIFPTLWSLPFLLNFLISERLSLFLVKYFQPTRFSSSTAGKFPAHYSYCRGGRYYNEKNLLQLGYRRIDVITYFGHRYFERIPLLNYLDKRLNRLFMRLGWVWLSSYCLVIATK